MSRLAATVCEQDRRALNAADTGDKPNSIGTHQTQFIHYRLLRTQNQITSERHAGRSMRMGRPGKPPGLKRRHLRGSGHPAASP